MNSNTEITEFSAVSERITATVHLTAGPHFTESYQGPLHIGYYPTQDEIFIELEGHRINVHQHLVAAVIKQLRRAAAIAKEQAE